MIDKDKIFKNFVQHSNSCILASYAIASNYYTEIPIVNYFRDYCQHFNLSLNDEIERYFSSISYQPEETTLNEFIYVYHFHREYQQRQISGLSLMKEIHEISTKESFVQSKFKINIESIPNVTADQQRIEDALKNENSLLVSAFNNGMHIAVFGYSELNWFTIETRPCKIVNTVFGQTIRPNKTGFLEITNLNHFGNLGDALLLKSNVNKN